MENNRPNGHQDFLHFDSAPASGTRGSGIVENLGLYINLIMSKHCRKTFGRISS